MYTILIVEDQCQIRKFSALTLDGFGCKILEAENGRQALEYIATEKVDLVLTDWSMPEMNGEEMLVRIRRDRHNNRVPVVVMSGCVCSSQRIEELGITTWLRKPCQMRDLQAAVTDVFECLRESESW